MKWIFIIGVALRAAVYFAPAFDGANKGTRIFLAIMASITPVSLAIIL